MLDLLLKYGAFPSHFGLSASKNGSKKAIYTVVHKKIPKE